MKVQGRCHCGQVRFEAEIDPDDVRICHCTDCQTFSGAPYRAGVPARAEALTMQGEKPSIYIKTAANGSRRAQAFCGNCGSAIYATTAENPQVYMLRLGAIEQRRLLSPRRQIWRRSALPWSGDLHDIASFDEQGSPA